MDSCQRKKLVMKRPISKGCFSLMFEVKSAEGSDKEHKYILKDIYYKITYQLDAQIGSTQVLDV